MNKADIAWYAHLEYIRLQKVRKENRMYLISKYFLCGTLIAFGATLMHYYDQVIGLPFILASVVVTLVMPDQLHSED